MWPRTSWSLSSLTRNIVLGRASVISPSISIFSSFAMRPGRVAGRSAALERRVAGSVLQEAGHGVLQILRGEQVREHTRGHLVRVVHPSFAVAANDPLGRPV